MSLSIQEKLLILTDARFRLSVISSTRRFKIADRDLLVELITALEKDVYDIACAEMVVCSKNPK